MSRGAIDARVPAHLGRVLNAGGEPVGTCFQVAAGVLATAWHVLDDVGAGEIAAVVAVDPLAGGEPRDATVAAIDPLADLAVLRVESPLGASIAGLRATDDVPLGLSIAVTGFGELEDPGHEYSHFDAAGEWAGGTTRDRQVPLGRLRSSDVVRGMSGAPVRERENDRVVGVVSGRYNSTDGWLAGTVWVARCERLATLCDGIAPIALADPAHPAAAIDLVLEIGDTDVRLTGPGLDVCAEHKGVRPGLANAVYDVRRARALAGSRATAQAEGPPPGELALDPAGRLLAESFLPEPISKALAATLARAEAAHQAVRLGVAYPKELAGLPWEALPDPRSSRPLALVRLVNVHRRAPASPPAKVPGPLRILVAIASPDHGGGPMLDYERELRNVLAAVRTARQVDADVRVVAFATTAAIRSALEAAPAHVLHLSGHGSPGSLVLEHDDGAARTIEADEFVDEAIPPGRMPAVVALAACYTNVADADGGPSFAARLLERGAAVVIASETSVTDDYATRVFARIYGRLADTPDPDVVAAVCDARRLVQAELDGSRNEDDRFLGSLGEWATLSVLAPAGEVVAFDPRIREEPPPPPRRITIGAVTARAVGDFVGRRRAQRRWPDELLSAQRSGIVLHGIGGVGKTTLAEELVGRVLDHEPGRALAVLTGPLTVEGVIGGIASALRRGLLLRGQLDGVFAQALGIAALTNESWTDRLPILREHLLGAIPLLVVLDNFEDNLDDKHALRDPILAALLAAWLADPGRSRLLVTCRHPFELPDGAERRLAFKPLGPLSAAETRKLIWSLPALDRLTDDEADRVWRMVGGHPRSLEYLDALLSRGEGRYPDITARLAKSVAKQLGTEQVASFLKADHELDGALAEVATLAADDVLLDDLLTSLRTTPGAEALLIGASVYREPVDLNALLFAVGEPDEAAASVPDVEGANERIREPLEAAGIATDAPIDANDLPPDLLEAMSPHRAELQRLPTPPRAVPEQFRALLGACLSSSLLSGTAGEEGVRFFAHRWTASELDRRLTDADRAAELTEAHDRAAGYWQWRVSVWPQGRPADVHDLLEARHHLLAADEVERAGQMTEMACSTLHVLGSWDEEAALIHDTLSRLPESSERRAAYIHQLGRLAQDRGDYAEAEQRYQQALQIHEQLGSQADVAGSYHQLGIVAQHRGDYAEAEQRYQQALQIRERLGNQADMSGSYHYLGWLAQLRGDYAEAEQRYQQALQINEQLGDQTGMSGSYHHLGWLAQLRGDYAEAEQRYQQSLQISERLGNQADMAAGYHNLGTIAQNRGEYAEAEQRYQQALQINERLGNQTGVSGSYHQLGILAQDRGDYAEAEQRYQQSLQISERLGNQAGMASGFSQLGILAQLRGDYAEAEQRYRQSLQIEERLGNQADIATTLSQLGILGAARGDAAGAVGLHGRALAIRAGLGVPEVAINVRHLGEHRAALGEDAFRQALAAGIGAESAAEMIAVLDELAHQQADGDDPGAGEAG